MRIIDDNYYFPLWVKFHVHRLKVEHSDPALYGLGSEWVERAQWRYRLYQKQEYEEKLKDLYKQRNEWTDMLRDRVGGRRDHSFIDKQLEEINQSIRKTEKRIAFLSLPKSQARQIDIARAKAIPIDSIYEVLPNGFFVNNPLRPERSPSNSLYLNRKTNKWQDFGTGAYGDLLDLVMKHHDCDLITAYRKVI